MVHISVFTECGVVQSILSEKGVMAFPVLGNCQSRHLVASKSRDNSIPNPTVLRRYG